MGLSNYEKHFYKPLLNLNLILWITYIVDPFGAICTNTPIPIKDFVSLLNLRFRFSQYVNSWLTMQRYDFFLNYQTFYHVFLHFLRFLNIIYDKMINFASIKLNIVKWQIMIVLLWNKMHYRVHQYKTESYSCLKTNELWYNYFIMCGSTKCFR